MNSGRLAKIISILSLGLWLPVFLILFTYKTGLSEAQIRSFLPLFSIFGILLPASYVILAARMKWVSAWDIPQRKQRYMLLVVALSSTLVSLIAAKIFGTRLLFDIFTILAAVVTLTSFITLFWKISLHMTVNVFGVVITNFLFGWTLPILYVLIPLIFWDRLRLKRHTALQLLVPIILDLVIIFSGLYLKGYL